MSVPYAWGLSHPGMRRMLIRLLAGGLVVFVGVPLLTLVLWSFAGEWFWPAVVPTQFTTRWYQAVLENPRVIDAMILSFTIAPVVTLLTALISIPAGYAFARLNVPFRRVLLLLFLIPNAFPRIGLYVSLAVLYYQVGLIDTFWGVVFLHMIGTPHFITMPVLMYTLISSFERPIAAVFSVLLTIPSLLLLFAAQRYLQSEYVAA